MLEYYLTRRDTDFGSHQQSESDTESVGHNMVGTTGWVHFHPNCKEKLIQKHFHPETLSFQKHFRPKSFHPKQKTISSTTLSSQNGFIQ